MTKRYLEAFKPFWLDRETFKYVLDREPKDSVELNAFFDILHYDVFSFMRLEEWIKEEFGGLFDDALPHHYKRIKEEMRLDSITNSET